MNLIQAIRQNDQRRRIEQIVKSSRSINQLQKRIRELRANESDDSSKEKGPGGRGHQAG